MSQPPRDWSEFFKRMSYVIVGIAITWNFLFVVLPQARSLLRGEPIGGQEGTDTTAEQTISQLNSDNERLIVEIEQQNAIIEEQQQAIDQLDSLSEQQSERILQLQNIVAQLENENGEITVASDNSAAQINGSAVASPRVTKEYVYRRDDKHNFTPYEFMTITRISKDRGCTLSVVAPGENAGSRTVLLHNNRSIVVNGKDKVLITALEATLDTCRLSIETPASLVSQQ